MQEVYYIGGGTCCGKSTLAERLTEKYGFRYYKLDDYLDDYIKAMAEAKHPLAEPIAGISMQDMWMRDPQIMFDEEWKIYEAMFPMAQRDIEKIGKGARILAEGAGFLPELMKKQGVDAAHYVCMAPTKDFQIEHYAKRPWIEHYLAGCSDPKKAFDNWMQRDVLFSEAVIAQAQTLSYETCIIDGKSGPEKVLDWVESVFRL
jgi:hypothetical protein